MKNLLKKRSLLLFLLLLSSLTCMTIHVNSLLVIYLGLNIKEAVIQVSLYGEVIIKKIGNLNDN